MEKNLDSQYSKTEQDQTESYSKDDIKKDYTRIPNKLIRSQKLDAFEKLVLMTIMSRNPSFPSYEIIQRDCRISRGKLWQCLRKLESENLIMRYQSGRSIVYVPWWRSSPRIKKGMRPVHYVNGYSSPGELEPVHHVNPNKTKEKDQYKKGDFQSSSSEEGDENNQTNQLENIARVQAMIAGFGGDKDMQYTQTQNERWWQSLTHIDRQTILDTMLERASSDGFRQYVESIQSLHDEGKKLSDSQLASIRKWEGVLNER